MRMSEKLMMGFVGVVFVAGLFGPYMISIGLGVVAVAVFATRHPGMKDRSGAL